MSNVNNYAFAKNLDQFKVKVLDPQIKRCDEAEVVMHDEKHVWKSDEEKKTSQAVYDRYKAWKAFYQAHYDEGMNLVKQHEALVDKMSKVYDSWFQNISNEGKQETELMSSQADILCELFGEIYKELAPLKLEGMKPPQGLNLK
jgi:hypothetical protein